MILQNIFDLYNTERKLCSSEVYSGNQWQRKSQQIHNIPNTVS